MRSLEAMASQVRNDVLSGLQGTVNFPISVEQIKDTITDMRARLIGEMVAKGQFSMEGFLQIVKVKAEVDPDEREIARAQIPNLIAIPKFYPIKYFGLPRHRKPYRVLRQHRHTKGRDIATSKAPTVWLDSDTDFEVLVKDCDQARNFWIEAIWADPRQTRFFGTDYSDDTVYPMSNAVADVVMGKLTNDYLRYYKFGQPQPVTGAHIVGGQPANNQPG